MADAGDDRERLKAYMNSPYFPLTRGVLADQQMANAATYGAHQLFQIREQMWRIAEALEKIAKHSEQSVAAEATKPPEPRVPPGVSSSGVRR